jgi:hypothetical protein
MIESGELTGKNLGDDYLEHWDNTVLMSLGSTSEHQLAS